MHGGKLCLPCFNSNSRAVPPRVPKQSLGTRERLTLHPKKQRISQVKEGLDLLGYTVFADFKLLRNDNGFRFSRRLNRLAKHYHSGYLQWGDFNASVQSWIGHAKNADTMGLRRHIFAKTVFKKGVCQ